MEFKYQSEAQQVNIKLWILWSEANIAISGNQISEEKRPNSILILYFKKRKKTLVFLKTKAKKRKGSIVNYRRVAIPRSTRFWTSGIFHESVSPKPLNIQLEMYQIFQKFAEIFANEKNLQSEKF
jgi:hypothetical protein